MVTQEIESKPTIIVIIGTKNPVEENEMSLGKKIAEVARKTLMDLEAEGKIDLKKMPLYINGTAYKVKAEAGSEPGIIHVTLTPVEVCPHIPKRPNMKDKDPLGLKNNESR